MNSCCGQTSIRRACEAAQRCPSVYFSFQLKHSPFSLRFCISSQEIFLVPPDPVPSILVGRLADPIMLEEMVFCTDLVVELVCGLPTLFYCRCLFMLLSLILANSMASESVFGLNIRIFEAMSSFNPPINAPTNAFCGQPSTRLASLSNFRWYSLNVPF